MEIPEKWIKEEQRKTIENQQEFIQFAIKNIDCARELKESCVIQEEWGRRDGKTWALKEVIKHYMTKGKNEVIYFYAPVNDRKGPEDSCIHLLSKDLGDLPLLWGKLEYNKNELFVFYKSKREPTLIIADDCVQIDEEWMDYECPIIRLSNKSPLSSLYMQVPPSTVTRIK